MKLIRPNCRLQFTAEDIEFILQTLRSKVKTADTLLKLLADEETRDLILDDETLWRAVLERPECLRISTHFYFYLLVRHALRSAGLQEREVADYVAAMLAEFSEVRHTQLTVRGQRLDYFVDMLAALQTVDDSTRFYLRVHMGNQSLFLSGMFPEHLRYREQTKAAPGLRYYEEIGRSSYRAARDHRLAETYRLTDVFDTLAERFETTRQALNEVSDRLIACGEEDNAVSRLLQSGSWSDS